jgi:serine/threonine protein kinase
MSIGAAVGAHSAAAPRDITEDYENLQIIGKGSFGTVYKAIRKSDGTQVVVKEVLITSLNEAERRCALQEASTLSKLQHDNIICYHETRSSEGVLHSKRALI